MTASLAPPLAYVSEAVLAYTLVMRVDDSSWLAVRKNGTVKLIRFPSRLDPFRLAWAYVRL